MRFVEINLIQLFTLHGIKSLLDHKYRISIDGLPSCTTMRTLSSKARSFISNINSNSTNVVFAAMEVHV